MKYPLKVRNKTFRGYFYRIRLFCAFRKKVVPLPLEQLYIINSTFYIKYVRKAILFILLLMAVSLQAAAHLEVNGNAILLDEDDTNKNIDYVYLFANISTAEFFTSDANPVWWRLENGDSTEIARGTNTLYPEDNTGYILHTDNGRITFWVLDYALHKPAIHSIEINSEFEDCCAETELLLEAYLPVMSYQDVLGITHNIRHTCEVTYHSLAWNGEEWQDSLCVEKDKLLGTVMRIGAPLQNTHFTISLNQFTPDLGLALDSISSREYEAIAVAAHPTTITTTRGSERENEVERPIEETQLSGSAPLDIYFKANATPNAKYYQWQLLKGNDLIAQRSDAEQRYTFDDYGEYRALYWASNDYCKTDSIEIKISVATSQLLVPNVFTPNGDGNNDEFRVMYKSIIEFHCWVYNRWGKKVFEWSDPAKGWDGTINGRKAAESAYFYVIRAVGADGKRYELKGDINLIRGMR